MSRLLTTPIENVEWSRYLREVSEKEKYNSAVIVKLMAELETAEQLKDADVSWTISHPSVYWKAETELISLLDLVF